MCGSEIAKSKSFRICEQDIVIYRQQGRSCVVYNKDLSITGNSSCHQSSAKIMFGSEDMPEDSRSMELKYWELKLHLHIRLSENHDPTDGLKFRWRGYKVR